MTIVHLAYLNGLIFKRINAKAIEILKMEENKIKLLHIRLTKLGKASDNSNFNHRVFEQMKGTTMGKSIITFCSRGFHE